MDFLEKLCNESGVSGDEEAVRNLILNEIRPYVTSVNTDVLGNIIAFKKGSQSDKSVLLDAHMDEVGLIISKIEDNGCLRFKTVGGIDPRVLAGKSVLIGPNKVYGIISLKAVHLTTRSEREEAVKIKNLYIDIGAASKEEAEKHIELGDYASFNTVYSKFGDNKIKAKALDDRVGCAILTKLLKETYPCDIYTVFSVQEEVGCRGAEIVMDKISPDAAIVVESTTCSDTSGVDKHLEVTTLGGGAALSSLDMGSYSDTELTKTLFNIAKEKNIAVQNKRTIMGGNNARAIQISRGAVKTAAVSVPCRYLHSPIGIISIDDYNSAYLLIKSFLSEAQTLI